MSFEVDYANDGAPFETADPQVQKSIDQLQQMLQYSRWGRFWNVPSAPKDCVPRETTLPVYLAMGAFVTMAGASLSVGAFELYTTVLNSLHSL